MSVDFNNSLSRTLEGRPQLCLASNQKRVIYGTRLTHNVIQRPDFLVGRVDHVVERLVSVIAVGSTIDTAAE
jgi:hypothetical protein